MAGDWIKVHRSLLDSQQMTDDWLCRLWIWCLLRANFEVSNFRGQQVMPGQFITGRITAAAELHVSPSKWYRGIQQLRDMGCIEICANSNWTTLTICNWKTYQEHAAKSEQPANSQRTAGDTTSGQPADTIKEGKNGRIQRREESNTPLTPQGGVAEVVDFGIEDLKPRRRRMARSVGPADAAIAGIEIDGTLVMYDDDPMRWEAAFIDWWNLLPGVSRSRMKTLNTATRRMLMDRLAEPDWHWKQAAAWFPLWVPSPDWVATLSWFVEPATVAKILEGRYEERKAAPRRQEQTIPDAFVFEESELSEP